MLRSKLVEELRKYPTLPALRASAFYREQAPVLNQLLNTPEWSPCLSAAPKLRDFLRVTSWNIEKGKQFDGLLQTFLEHPILHWSDLILLNEVDVGMSRSMNRHIARELARFLGMHCVFAPAHLELTRGIGDDLLIPGENTSALQGNAILSRYPMAQPRIIDLPICSEHFDLEEKRYGRRIALVVDLQTEPEPMTVVCAHLEVRNTPACRTRQMDRILESLDSGGSFRTLIAGDFNTNTFLRGNAWRTLRALVRLLGSDPVRLQRRLLSPHLHNERLFQSLVRHGFILRGFNDQQSTAVAPLKGIEDGAFIPGFVRRWATHRMGRYNFRLELRLDWFAGQGLLPLSSSAARDETTGVVSVSAQTIKHLTHKSRPISDHDPIVVDIAL